MKINSMTDTEREEYTSAVYRVKSYYGGIYRAFMCWAESVDELKAKRDFADVDEADDVDNFSTVDFLYRLKNTIKENIDSAGTTVSDLEGVYYNED